MKYISSKSLITLLFIIILSGNLVLPNTLAEVQKPDWVIGSWWEYTTVNVIHVQETGAAEYMDMTLTDENTQHNLTSIENKTLTHGVPFSYDAYVLPFSGIVNGEGNYHITDPFPMDIPIEIRDATLTGELWIDVVTHATIFSTRSMSGPLWANILGSWQEVGTADITVNEEYEPGRLLASFPMDIGDSWVQDLTFYTFGDYLMSGSIMGTPFNEDGTFDENEVYQLNMTVTSEEPSHGFDTYRIDGTVTGSSGTIQTNYGPEPQNIVFDQLLNFGNSGSVQVNSITKTLTDYYLESGDCVNHGDVNLDGEITAGDAQLAFMTALGSYSPTPEEECAADCNGDGTVTAGDAQAVFLVALGASPSCADPLGSSW